MLVLLLLLTSVYSLACAENWQYLWDLPVKNSAPWKLYVDTDTIQDTPIAYDTYKIKLEGPRKESLIQEVSIFNKKVNIPQSFVRDTEGNVLYKMPAVTYDDIGEDRELLKIDKWVKNYQHQIREKKTKEAMIQKAKNDKNEMEAKQTAVLVSVIINAGVVLLVYNTKLRNIIGVRYALITGVITLLYSLVGSNIYVETARMISKNADILNISAFLIGFNAPIWIISIILKLIWNAVYKKEESQDND